METRGGMSGNFAARVAAPSLAEALRRARALYGADVGVLDSRTVVVNAADGLGSRRLVEVRVASAAGAAAASRQGDAARIERLAAMLGRAQGVQGAGAEYPLADVLATAGASASTIAQLADRFAGLPAAARQDAEAHLRGTLRVSGGAWDGVRGAHVFLGAAGCGRTDLALGVAARLRRAGARPLFLQLLPRHEGEIARVRVESARHGFDAAVVHGAEQLAGHVERFGRHGAVLIDTPAVFSAALAAAGDLQRFVAESAALRRHLVVPADADLEEQADLWRAARTWRCDGTAVTRLDRARKPGKLLDLASRVALPFSFVTCGAWPQAAPELARAEALAAWILDGGGRLARAATA